MKVAVSVLLLAVVVALVSSYALTRPVVSGITESIALASLEMAPRDRAVTLARHRSGAMLLVIDVDEAGITAVDISDATGVEYTDSLHVFRELGKRGLQKLYGGLAVKRMGWEQLGSPLDGHYPHVAAGTNFRGHAEEVGHEGDPFLFPKLSRATAWNSDVLAAGRLDYEVELCAVPLTEHKPTTPARLGYVLCNDFTDRWQLVKDIDLGGEMGLTGFVLAKGGDSRLPIGALLVIPQDENFYQELQLDLFVNGRLRQSASAGSMIWSPRQLLSKVLAACETDYEMADEMVRIGACDHIPAGTLLLTGTPEGVMFHPATLWNPWAYLADGDVVTSVGSYLGFMRNLITEP
ncbi:hypothetical protein EYC98_16765 [Halieaceae bacterium IMCC14734]|uniref:Fumarylacetoacetase-like C-terminal domain-containing protein n=1 Tax=Candidatus Litorirhabdus singularis TaxID=2518993 RepID=A0ABT3TLA1_9GAMM|nr:fumarylacetoacetate hydrolase family protein [Candidatus Litorirhabdus singularis]MCX2982516.1 hypothetical protein [Candidatus Litorirhabdus singularis]